MDRLWRKKKSAENIMQQIVLAQTEYYSTTGAYYETGDCASSYDASTTTSQKIEDDLLFMDTNETGKWKSFKFTLGTNELVIFDRNYIIALTKLPSSK